eukprot:4961079-Pyramimonas_sp.AAC.2
MGSLWTSRGSLETTWCSARLAPTFRLRLEYYIYVSDKQRERLLYSQTAPAPPRYNHGGPPIYGGSRNSRGSTPYWQQEA